jgi:CheY-like chemotaxis protein
MSSLILVVDDESDVEMLFRQQFKRELRAGRFTMDFAQSGDSALPGMSGLELLPRAKTARPDVPVIMITAYGDDVTKRKALEGGAEGLLTKPIDFVALRSEIDRRIGRAS